MKTYRLCVSKRMSKTAGIQAAFRPRYASMRKQVTHDDQSGIPLQIAGAVTGISITESSLAAPNNLAAGVIAGVFGPVEKNEIINPDVEDAFWREQHPVAPYAIGEPYEDYESAYRAGYEAYAENPGKSFADAETDIRKKYESMKQYESMKPLLPWKKARPAAQAAWSRIAARPD